MFTEKNPSKEYLKHINYYKKMHLEGHMLSDGRMRKSEKTYEGKSTLGFAPLIRNIIKKNKLKTLLDYGCGKGYYYDNKFNIEGKKINLREYWDINIDLYDPCFAKYSEFPEKKFDITISVDVFEHIPNGDIDWILEKICKISNEYIFLNVACYKAIALLPNGENAHINIKEPKWWFNKLISFKKKFMHLKMLCVCATKNEKNMLEYYPINIDDKVENYSS